jgi:hypothetical protein
MKKYITDALNPAGGVLYHYLALKHRRNLWRPFIRELGRWLSGWRPPEDRILLVGASGGYTLPAEFLSRFRSIDVVEPDPIARLIFRHRFRRLGVDIGWSRTDYLGPGQDDIVDGTANAGFDAARTLSMLEKYPGRAVLFCNVLGQLCILHPEETARASFKTWAAALFNPAAGRSIASYHDRLSGPVSFTTEDRVPPDFSSAGLARAFCPPDENLTLLDHATGDIFQNDFKRAYFNWCVTPGQYHLIEGVFILKTADDSNENTFSAVV